MIAAFHSTGAKYGRKKCRWLFRMPSAQADSTSTPVIGKKMRTTAIMSSRRSPSKPGVKTLTSTGASSTPSSASTPATPSSSANTAPATRPASFVRPWPRSSE